MNPSMSFDKMGVRCVKWIHRAEGQLLTEGGQLWDNGRRGSNRHILKTQHRHYILVFSVFASLKQLKKAPLQSNFNNC